MFRLIFFHTDQRLEVIFISVINILIIKVSEINFPALINIGLNHFQSFSVKAFPVKNNFCKRHNINGNILNHRKTVAHLRKRSKVLS